jgi:mRNA interferase RelE/StbE
VYEVEVSEKINEKIEKFPKKDLERIIDKIDKLAKNSRPRWSEKLTGRNSYRIPVGNYRVLYSVNDDEKQVVVQAIGHRKDIYKE